MTKVKPLQIKDILLRPSREVHLWYGPPDAGKSTRILEVASLHPDARCSVIDGDGRFIKVWREEWPFVENINYYPVKDWDETKSAYDDSKATLKEGDWLFLEMVGKYWDMAQNRYLIEYYGESYEEWLFRLKAEEKKKADPNSLGMWQVVKAMHNMSFMDDATSFLLCHVVLTAAAQPIMIGLDSKNVIDLFGAFRFKPEGEKGNIHRVDTGILFDLEYEGGHPVRTWTTVKDKGGRKRAWRQPYDGEKEVWWTTYRNYTTGKE